MKPIPLLTLSLHPADMRFDRRSTEIAFREVQSLNANGIRMDVSWGDIEPRPDRWDAGRLQWYRDYFDRARQLKLRTITVLYGLPMWVRILSWVRPDSFLKRWEVHCRKVETILGDAAGVVQVWNEVNHPFFQWAPRRTIPSLFRIARENLGAARKIAVNVYDGFAWWQSYLTQLLAETGDCIDIIGIDSFPETYRLNNARSWDPLEVLLKRVNDPGDTWYGRKPALLEVGFSTYIPFVKTPRSQSQWIEGNFDAISRVNDAFQNSLYIVNWYKLFNSHREGFLNVLGHFGVVGPIRKSREITRKQPAYNSLAEAFRRLHP